MSPARWLSPRGRVALRFVLAVVFLAGPIWASVGHVGDSSFTYERVEVVVDETEGITYANDSVSIRKPISDDLGCTALVEGFRRCAYEQYLLSNATVPSGWYASNPSGGLSLGTDRYEYVQLNGSTYRPTTVVNESVRNEEGLYRVELALERVPPRTALESIARTPDPTDREVPRAVARAATDGGAATHRNVDAPATVFAVDGDYYRVYRAGESSPSVAAFALRGLLLTVAPAFGLWLLALVARRVEIDYVDPESGRDAG